jgi:succinoglycan biosynthesis protein ExoM
MPMLTTAQPTHSADQQGAVIAVAPPQTAALSLMCVGVCTAGRPQLLSKCLASLVLQRLPRNYACVLIVVDNDAEPRARPIVEAAAAHSRFPICYLHETRRGISFARNRVLEEALDIGAHWVGFIDDDETAPPDWLTKMIAASRRYQADVLQGPVKPVYPRPLPFWALRKPSELAEGETMKFAATNNVIFSERLIRADGMDLRFDEAMGISGGEDTDFFLRARMRGARIIFSERPAIREEVPSVRLTYARQMQRAFRNGANDVYIKRKYYGVTIFVRRLPQILFRIPRGAVQMLISPLLAPFSLHLFKKAALEGGRKISKSLGVLAGLGGLRPGAYRKIDGC